MKYYKKERGFTIVELLISTAVFSVVLLLLATAIVQVGRMFYKGVTINRTQDTARKLADDMIQAIQFGPSSNTFYATGGGAAGTTQTLCLGDVRYTYITSKPLGNGASQSLHVVWKDRLGATLGCPVATPDPLTVAIPAGGGEEMLGGSMRVPFGLSAVQTGNVWKLDVTVSYGDTDDVFAKDAMGVTNYGQCAGRNIGGQFCAVSAITSNVIKRL